MRVRFYIIIPVVAFILILANAFYGHSVFSFNHPEDISKYSIYVHFQPEWNSHPSNLLFDVTVVWNNYNNDNSDNNEVYYDESSTSDLDIQHNNNQLRYIQNKSFVELKHRFDQDCSSNWQPILYRYAIDSLRNQLDVMAGNAIPGDHPYMILYPAKPAAPHQLVNNNDNARYVQFIPICSSKGGGPDSATTNTSTSYQYSIKTNNPDITFDAFFVKNASVYHDLANGDLGRVDFVSDITNNPQYYTNEGCFVFSHTSFNDTCTNISEDAGLLIVIPDNLNLSLTKITVNLREV